MIQDGTNFACFILPLLKLANAHHIQIKVNHL